MNQIKKVKSRLRMNSGRVRKLKVVLTLVTVAYVAYLQLEEENKAKKRKKKDTVKRKYELNRAASSSSDDEAQCKVRRKLSFPSKVKVEPHSNDEFADAQDPLNDSDARSSYRHQASPDFVDSFVSKFSEDQFKDAFRISRNTANRLFIRFKSSPEYKKIFRLSDQTRIPAKHYIWMFLWFVGRKCSYLELSKMFNVPLCKSVCVVDTVLQFFNNCAREFIRFPETPTELRASADSFEQIAGIPEVVACLISTQIQTKDSKGAFTVQVFCDSKARFLDVFVDSTVNIHPTEVLEKSQINEKLRDICQGRYHTLANEDYFAREWLLTPIDKPTSPEHIRYNQKHAKTMHVVSDSLELLTQRFQQLTTMHFFSSYKIKRMFIACCVLQNICLEEEDFFDSEEDHLLERYSVSNQKENEVQEKPLDDNTHLRRIGELKRKQIIGVLKPE